MEIQNLDMSNAKELLGENDVVALVFLDEKGEKVKTIKIIRK